MEDKELIRRLYWYWDNPHYSDEELIEYTSDLLNAYKQDKL